MLTFKEFVEHDSTYQLDEGLGDWIEKKMDSLLGNDVELKPTKAWSDKIADIMDKAPKNASGAEADKMVEDFLKKAELKRQLEKAAASQKTTIENIKKVLKSFVGKFIAKWKEIPAADRANAWKNLATSVLRLLMFILKAMAKK
jgi:hypothetical protein